MTKKRPQNATRERDRLRTLQLAFKALQAALPSVPGGTKLSKLDILLLARTYICHLLYVLGRIGREQYMRSQLCHSSKKWPLRERLYLLASKGTADEVPGQSSRTSSSQNDS
uniref:BHLH domain-containing protein n=1 Tax=Macrostomum lignano TaxID=282301 RepID=A0A1I8H997_9PLAT